MSRVPQLQFIRPQIPALTHQPPEGSDWIHEIKHDGYRTIIVKAGKDVRAFTRNGFNWTERYPQVSYAGIWVTPGQTMSSSPAAR